MHIFPKFVLQQLETAHDASWKAPFRPPTPAHVGSAPIGPLLKNQAIRLGARRASIYGTTKAVKTMAHTPKAKDHVRESHARELTGRQARPKILDEQFLDYQKL